MAMASQRRKQTCVNGNSYVNPFFYHSSVVPADMPIDPNEPLYCYCQQVSFGEMVACDNTDVSIRQSTATLFNLLSLF